jgi:hypothetical protein
MATERVLRESLQVNPGALQITINPIKEDIPSISQACLLISAYSSLALEAVDFLLLKLCWPSLLFPDFTKLFCSYSFSSFSLTTAAPNRG